MAASLILVSDEVLAMRLGLYTLLPIRSRRTTVMKLQPMNKQETRLYIENRLKNCESPPGLFADEATAILAAHTRGIDET